MFRTISTGKSLVKNPGDRENTQKERNMLGSSSSKCFAFGTFHSVEFQFNANAAECKNVKLFHFAVK